MNPRRSGFIAVAAVLSLLLITPAFTPAAAQDFPQREIRMIVPLPPGGAIDIMARTLQAVLDDMGVRVVVDNRAGGGTATGLIDVAQAQPDGYTVGVATTAILSLMALGQVPLEPDSFTNITRLSEDPQLLLVRPDAPWDNVEEFMEALAADPDSIAIGHPLINNPMHAMAALTGRAVDVEARNVPFDGGAPVAAALLGGHIDAGVFLSGLALTYVEPGELRALAVYENERLEALPDVPTFAEAGYDAFGGLGGPVAQASFIVTPAGLDPELLDALVDIFQEAVLSDRFQSFAADSGFRADGLSAEELDEYLGSLFDRLGAVMPTLVE